MKAILIDDQGHRETMDLFPEDTIIVADKFIPCGVCGLAVLPKFFEDDCCAACAREDDKVRAAYFDRKTDTKEN